MKQYRYKIVIHPGEEGQYWVDVPSLPGCFAQGTSIEDAINLAKEAIALHIQGMIEDGEEVPKEDIPTVDNTINVFVEVAA